MDGASGSSVGARAQRPQPFRGVFAPYVLECLERDGAGAVGLGLGLWIIVIAFVLISGMFWSSAFAAVTISTSSVHSTYNGVVHVGLPCGFAITMLRHPGVIGWATWLLLLLAGAALLFVNTALLLQARATTSGGHVRRLKDHRVCQPCGSHH